MRRWSGRKEGRKLGRCVGVDTRLKKQTESRDRMSFRCDENGEVWERVGFE